MVKAQLFAQILLMTKILTTCCALLLGGRQPPTAAIRNLGALRAETDFYRIPKEALEETLELWGYPSYRVRQVRENIYDKGIPDFMSMRNVPQELRTKLASHYKLGCLELAAEKISKDGTIKRAYKLPDQQIIESVLMPYEDGRRTACISSQAGCGMRCAFCATGQMGFSRQLRHNEIFEQAQRFSQMLKEKKERLSNVVLMGMGEPLNNYDNVLLAVRRLNTDLGIGLRHITISTVGIAPRIRQLATDLPQVGLAVSLHQANDEDRSALMPVNLRYPIAELMDACKYHTQVTGRRISFEWALIHGKTDTIEAARQLGKLLSGMLCHVNVIPLNPTQKFEGKPSTKGEVSAFIRELAKFGVTATQRIRRGIDIDAGCGQLKADLIRNAPATKAAASSDSDVLASADSVAQPIEASPSTPVTTSPSTPVTTSPSKPVKTSPSKPVKTSPSKSVKTKPAKPVTSSPTEHAS